MKSANAIESLIKAANSERAPGQDAAGNVVAVLLEEVPPLRDFLTEVTVRRPARGKIFVATYWGPDGKQVWRTTGLTNYQQALRLAKRWEREARLARSRKPPRTHGFALPALRTQQEVAKLMRLSVRTIAQIERAALDRLRQDAALKRLWAEYREGGK